MSILYCFPVVAIKLPTLSVTTSVDEVKAFFSCLAVDFSPKEYTITWLKNKKKINQTQISASSKEKTNVNGTFYTVASFMELEEYEWKDENTVITCEFSNGKESVEASQSFSGQASQCQSEYNFCNVE